MQFSRGEAHVTEKVASRSRDHQVVCAGKDSEAPELSCSLSIPMAAITAMLSSIPT